jgi:putative ABC transport system permease protein
LARGVTEQLHALDHNLPVFGVQTLGQYRYDRTAESRLGSGLLAFVGALALILACLGVYSMIAFSVGQRTREIGVRIALGAAQLQVVSLFLREGVRLTMVGVGAGLFLSAIAVKLLSSMFLGVGLIDSLAFIVVALILSAVAGLASWVPARRAALVDPMVALRSE